MIIDLFLHVEGQLPARVGHVEFLVLMLHLRCQLSEQMVRAEEREEGMCVTFFTVKCLGGQADYFRFWHLLVYLLIDIVVVQVHLAIQVQGTARALTIAGRAMGSIGSLSLLFLESASRVDLVASSNFSSDLLSVGDFARGQPWVSNDIGDTETLMRVHLQHAGHEILELLRVEAL